MDRFWDYEPHSSDSDFITEEDIDNCVIEKILQNRFHDPLLSSESEDESTPRVTLDWDKIFARKENNKAFRPVIQGYHPVPHFTKQSALTSHQHYQCLKVLSFQEPDVLPGHFMGRPTKLDYKVFEEVAETYAKEQQEFKEWAKSLWTSDHCVRALRPKPPIEMVYEADFKVTAHSMQSFPKEFGLAAQIPLEAAKVFCEMVPQKEIIKVNQSLIPKIQMPDMTQKTSVMQNCHIPEPCRKHPYPFCLPDEVNMTLLPFKEVQNDLAQFASDNGAMHIASEAALRCLVQQNRRWAITVSVCRVINTDGEECNVVVLGDEFSTHKETAQIRTYKAFRRLLEYTLIPPMEIKKANKERNANASDKNNSSVSKETVTKDVSDDEDNLYIDTDYATSHRDSDCESTEQQPEKKQEIAITSTIKTRLRSQSQANTSDDSAGKVDFYNCTCEGTIFEKPALRSYRRWQVRNCTTLSNYDVIVHCSQKAKDDSGEVILEPIPEYQIDLGGSRPPPDNIRALVLAMMLRRTATAINVRIDSTTGEIVTTDILKPEQLTNKYGDVIADVSSRLHTALDLLQGLLPGDYVLQHEANHGANAMLYARRGGRARLALQFDGAAPDEAGSARLPPDLLPVLLPIHKYRKTLPCAFTPFENQVRREPPRPSARPRAPPPALAVSTRLPPRSWTRRRMANNERYRGRR